MSYAKAIAPPVILYAISLTFTLLYSYQSPYIIGADTLSEYRIFIETIINGGWSVGDKGILNSCLSVSFPPTIVTGKHIIA